MTKLLPVLTICAVLYSGQGVSTKLDFDDESATVVNSTQVEDDDVEVKHTIVVSTKLKNTNGNRRGLHSNAGDPGILSYNIGRKDHSFKEDSDEVPIIQGYKAVDTTQIRTPDTRFQPPAATYPESVYISRNIRDDYDIYPNLATNPTQWQPSSYFNNVNYFNPDHGRDSNFVRRIDRPYQTPGKIHRKVTDDGMKEFYCRKCRELSGRKGCLEAGQSRSWVETTTAKVKIDGKLAKLN